MDNTTQEWLKNNKKICLCNSITRKTIVDAIKNGAKTLDEVAIATRAGTGNCKGARCDEAIEEILKEING